MPDPISAIAGGSLVTGLIGAGAARDAASTQAAATREGMEAQERMFERQMAAQEPFRQSGFEAQNMLMQELRGFQPYRASAGLSPNELAAQRFEFQADPGYAFRLAEGLKALEQSAAARGGLLSGNTGKNLQRYGQNLASQEYSNAFNRFQQERAARTGLGQMEYGQFAGERSARLLPLMQAAASGQGLTSNIAGQMANLGAAQAAGAGQIGAAQAAGTMGMANALAGGVGQAGNLYMQQQMLNALQRPTYTPVPMSYGYASQYGQGTL